MGGTDLTTLSPKLGLNDTGEVAYPCLSEGTSEANMTTPPASNLPGCNLPSSVYDASQSGGTGALRLTTDDDSEAGGSFYDLSFPTAQGLDISFDTYQYTSATEQQPNGVNGWNAEVGDGLGFALAAVNPSAPREPSVVGPPGGSLGYSTDALGSSDLGEADTGVGTAVPGLTDGYLGFGLDVLGNSSNPDYQGLDCHYSGGGAPDGVALGLGGQGEDAPYPNQITVKGPGNQYNGYCLLDDTATALSSDNETNSTGNASPDAPAGTFGTGYYVEGQATTGNPVGGTLGGAAVTGSYTSSDPGSLVPTFCPAAGGSGICATGPSDYWYQTPDAFDATGVSDADRPQPVQVEIIINTSNVPGNADYNGGAGEPESFSQLGSACPADRPLPGVTPAYDEGGAHAGDISEEVQPGFWGLCVVPLTRSTLTGVAPVPDDAGAIFVTDKMPVVDPSVCTAAVAATASNACAVQLGGGVSSSYYPAADGIQYDSSGYPDQLTLGWTASTSPTGNFYPGQLLGGAEIHEVNKLSVQTTAGNSPILGVANCDTSNATCPVTTAGSWAQNQPVTFDVRPTVTNPASTSGGPESEPMFITDSFPTGAIGTSGTALDWSSTTVAAGDANWNCGNGTSPQVLTAVADCTPTAAATAIDPALANVTVEVDCSTGSNGWSLVSSAEQLECTDTPLKTSDLPGTRTAMPINAGDPLPVLTVTGASVTAAVGTTLSSTAEISSIDGFPASSTDSAVVIGSLAGTISATPSSVPADGATSSTVTVTLTSGGSPVTGKTVSLAQGSGHSVVTTVTGVTNSSGVATFTVTDTTAETVTYSATDTTDPFSVPGNAPVTFTPVSGGGGGGGGGGPTPTSTVVVPSPSSTVTPQAQVTYTATTTPDGGLLVDGGTISFFDGSTATPIPGCQAVAVSNSTGHSVATCSTSYSTVGTHTILALYSGDANFSSSQGTTLETVVTSFTMTATASPSTAPAGNPVALSAHGIPSAATGTVTFASGGATLCSYSLATASSCETSVSLPAGAYPVIASYSGDSTHPGATAPTTFTLTAINPLTAITPYEKPVSIAVTLPGTPKIATQAPSSEGSCSLNGDGTIEFTPAFEFSGVSVCTYTLTTNGLTSLPATVTVTVLPAANPKTFPGPGPTTTAVLPHPDGTGPFTYRIIKQPPSSEGVCSISQAGVVTFNRDPGFAGDATCTYAVVDRKGSISNEATITILGGKQQVAIQGHTPKGVCLTLQTTLPKGPGPYTFTLTSQIPAADGTGSFSPNGAYRFCPTASFTGGVSFTYIVKNGAGQATPGTVNIQVGTSGTVIPGAHTGEDWSSSIYWYAVAAAGELGGVLVVASRLRRSRS